MSSKHQHPKQPYEPSDNRGNMKSRPTTEKPKAPPQGQKPDSGNKHSRNG